MTENDKKEFAIAMHEVLGSYNQECGRFTLRLWWSALERYDLQTVLNALAGYCAHQDKCKFAPKAGDIVGMIEGTKAEKTEAAEYAWQRTYDAIGTYGRYKSVAFDDPAIHYALMLLGGWEEFCGMMEDEKPFRRKDFISAYAAYRNGLPYPPHLSGMAERENVGKGVDVKIEYIGNHDVVKSIIADGRVGGMAEMSATDVIPTINTPIAN